MTTINLNEGFRTFQGLPMRLSDVTITLQNVLVTVDRLLNKELDLDAFKAQLELVVKENPPLTLRDVCLNSLASPRSEEKLSGTEKFRRGLLGHKMAEAQEIELPAEDITLLKRVIDETYPSPLVVFNAWLMLDPSDTATKEPSSKKKEQPS